MSRMGANGWTSFAADNGGEHQRGRRTAFFDTPNAYAEFPGAAFRIGSRQQCNLYFACHRDSCLAPWYRILATASTSEALCILCCRNTAARELIHADAFRARTRRNALARSARDPSLFLRASHFPGAPERVIRRPTTLWPVFFAAKFCFVIREGPDSTPFAEIYTIFKRLLRRPCFHF